MEGPQFRQELSQQLKLCPQLMQNIALLQMNVQDLREFLERAVEENPMLEQQEPSGDAFRELSARNEWMRTSSDAPPEPGAEDRELTSRESFLRDQLARRKLPPKLLSLCTYLIELLDEDGFLPPEELEHLHHLGLPDPMLEEALAAVQALEPAGIAARSLSECLLIQLRRSGQETPLLTELVSHHLEALARQQYSPLAHLLHCSKAEVENAAAQIAQLDPHPGRWDAPVSEPVQYIQPDAYVLDENGALSVVLNDFYLPHLTLSSQYEEMMRSADAETASYLRRTCKQAQELLSGLSRRGETLRRCLEAVVSTQAPFFLLPDGVLSPMTRRTLAESLGLNPSTITRALKGKYLQCRRGIYPLSAFFSQPVGGSSPQEIRTRMVQLLQQEPMLNDRLLRERLAQEGYRQYEISNFACPGHEGRHNLLYWNCKDYWGIGPAAHSCLGSVRRFWPNDTAAFIAGTVQEQYEGSCNAEDYLIMQLRLCSGLNLTEYAARYGVRFDAGQMAFLRHCAASGYAVLDGDTLRLTPSGMIVQNAILEELI